jgi:hypothetical protein
MMTHSRPAGFSISKQALNLGLVVLTGILIVALLVVTTEAKSISTENDSLHLQTAIKITGSAGKQLPLPVAVISEFSAFIVESSEPLGGKGERVRARGGFATQTQTRSPPHVS